MSALLEYLGALPFILALAAVAWCVCTLKRNVGLIDIFWPLFMVAAALYFLALPAAAGTGAWLALTLLAVWASRLAVHLAVRNWNAPEDHRYQAIRARNQPRFAVKSLYLVFGLQALLALVVAAPLYEAIGHAAPLRLLHLPGALLVLAGIVIESVADAQLTAFRSQPANGDRVLDSGLWRYSRHPNYFGEFCVWWGFFLMAPGVGAWTIVSPLLMSLLLVRVSGVTLLEEDIYDRRPGYARYVARTNAFIPGPRRHK